MRIEEKFNMRSATPIEVQPPVFHIGSNYSVLGVRATFHRAPGDPDRSTLSMHMTPDEALVFAAQLIYAAREAMQ